MQRRQYVTAVGAATVGAALLGERTSGAESSTLGTLGFYSTTAVLDANGEPLIDDGLVPIRTEREPRRSSTPTATTGANRRLLDADDANTRPATTTTGTATTETRHPIENPATATADPPTGGDTRRSRRGSVRGRTAPSSLERRTRLGDLTSRRAVPNAWERSARWQHR